MHRRPNLLNRLPRWAVPIVAATAAALLVGWGVSVAATPQSTVIACGDGSDLLVHPGGTWNCATPAVSPSGSASPSDSPSPSPSTSSGTPSTSPSPSPSGSASPTPSPSTSSSGCPVAGKNVPGAADPWGGCWPGPGNTGVPAGVTLTNYTGPCTITVANTVIDHKTVTCETLDIQVSGVVIKNSRLQGVDVNDGDIQDTDDPAHAAHVAASFTIQDSTVINGARDQCACIGYHDFTATRVEVIGGNRSMYCVTRCVIQDSWMHGQQLLGAQHGSGLREEQYTTAVHNALTCDYLYDPSYDERSCSASLTGYADFAPIHDNTIKRNLFVDGHLTAFCMYGGATAGKPYSSDPLNGTHQVFTENVFQRGQVGASGTGPHCGDYGPVTDFNLSGAGNVFSATWDDGTPLTSADL